MSTDQNKMASYSKGKARTVNSRSDRAERCALTEYATEYGTVPRVYKMRISVSISATPRDVTNQWNGSMNRQKAQIVVHARMY